MCLCSNAKEMPASVREALKVAFQQEGALSSEEAEQMLVVMENSGRLQYETWSWSASHISRRQEATFRLLRHVADNKNSQAHHSDVRQFWYSRKNPGFQWQPALQRGWGSDEDAALWLKTTSTHTKGSESDVQALSKLLFTAQDSFWWRCPRSSKSHWDRRRLDFESTGQKYIISTPAKWSQFISNKTLFWTFHSLPEGKHVHVIDLFWEVDLLLLVDDAETRLRNKPLKDLQVATDAAVHLVGDHAFIWHIVLDDDEASGSQSLAAAFQEVHQVVVSQVTYRKKRIFNVNTNVAALFTSLRVNTCRVMVSRVNRTTTDDIGTPHEFC